MQGRNLQVRISAETAARLEKLAGKAKSAFVRAAIEEKLKREHERRLEQQWISALQRAPDQQPDDEDWLASEAWDSK